MNPSGSVHSFLYCLNGPNTDFFLQTPSSMIDLQRESVKKHVKSMPIILYSELKRKNGCVGVERRKRRSFRGYIRKGSEALRQTKDELGPGESTRILSM